MITKIQLIRSDLVVDFDFVFDFHVDSLWKQWNEDPCVALKRMKPSVLYWALLRKMMSVQAAETSPSFQHQRFLANWIVLGSPNWKLKEPKQKYSMYHYPYGQQHNVPEATLTK